MSNTSYWLADQQLSNCSHVTPMRSPLQTCHRPARSILTGWRGSLFKKVALSDDWWCVSLMRSLRCPPVAMPLKCCQLHFIIIHSYPMAAARFTSIHSFDLFSVLLFSFITSLISVLFYHFLFYLMFYPRYILESRPTIPICL